MHLLKVLAAFAIASLYLHLAWHLMEFTTPDLGRPQSDQILCQSMDFCLSSSRSSFQKAFKALCLILGTETELAHRSALIILVYNNH